MSVVIVSAETGRGRGEADGERRHENSRRVSAWRTARESASPSRSLPSDMHRPSCRRGAARRRDAASELYRAGRSRWPDLHLHRSMRLRAQGRERPERRVGNSTPRRAASPVDWPASRSRRATRKGSGGGRPPWRSDLHPPGPPAFSVVALALALAAAPLRPAHADVVVDGSSASTSIQVMSGEFLFEFAAPVTQQQSPVVDFESNQQATPPGPFPATARSRQTASVVPLRGRPHGQRRRLGLRPGAGGFRAAALQPHRDFERQLRHLVSRDGARHGDRERADGRIDQPGRRFDHLLLAGRRVRGAPRLVRERDGRARGRRELRRLGRDHRRPEREPRLPGAG